MLHISMDKKWCALYFGFLTESIVFTVPSVPFSRFSKALVSQMWLMNLDCLLKTVSFMLKYTCFRSSKDNLPEINHVDIQLISIIYTANNSTEMQCHDKAWLFCYTCGWIKQFHCRTLAKEGPWAVHLTLGLDWGMGRYSRYQCHG